MATQPFDLVRGSSRVITMLVYDPDSNAPRDLTNITAITVSVAAAAGGFVTKTLASGAVAIVSPATSGTIRATFAAADTLLMALNSKATVTLSLTDSVDTDAQPKIIDIKKVFNVNDPG